MTASSMGEQTGGPKCSGGSSANSILYPARYDMLDAWRGMAALTVVLAHLKYPALGKPAVMMFFVISGYCICAAAESCRARGSSFRTFMWRRIRRIFPPYWCALAFFTVKGLIIRSPAYHEQLAQSPLMWLANLTLTQWLYMLFHPAPPLPAVSPNILLVSWTLCYEEQFYLLMALLLACLAAVPSHRFKKAKLLLSAVIILTAAGTVWNAFFPDTIYGIFLDYWTDFAVGCLIFYRLCRLDRAWMRHAIDLTLIAFLAWGIAARWQARSTYTSLTLRLAPWELAMAAFCGVVLIALRPVNDRFCCSSWGRWFMQLGLISYSLYLIHLFNLGLALVVVRHLIPVHNQAVTLSGQLIFLIGLAAVFWYFCERPFLNRSLPSEFRKPAMEETAATKISALS